MRSYVMKFSAMQDATVPGSNGYLLFSALCQLVRGTPLDDVFHPTGRDGKKSFALSFLRHQSGFSDNAPGGEDLIFGKGESGYSRIAFMRDTDGEKFAALLFAHEGTTLRLGRSLFRLEKILRPGEHELALALDPEQLIPVSPASEMGFRFVSPTGFKRDGRQFFLPLPELIFGDLLRKWRLFIAPQAWPNLENTWDNIEIQRYRMESRAARLRADRILRGFCGEIEYVFPTLSPEDQTGLCALAGLAFFTGVGYKTTQGLGEVWPFWRE